MRSKENSVRRRLDALEAAVFGSAAEARAALEAVAADEAPKKRTTKKPAKKKPAKKGAKR